MYKQNKMEPSALRGLTPTKGETMEQKMVRILENKEPMNEQGVELIYPNTTDVLPEFDIRTNKWEVAVDAMEKMEARKQLKKQEAEKAEKEKQGAQDAPNSGTSSSTE